MESVNQERLMETSPHQLRLEQQQLTSLVHAVGKTRSTYLIPTVTGGSLSFVLAGLLMLTLTAEKDCSTPQQQETTK